ncbi:hypothetical protein M404DRAFT_645593 [Pisolithus tinctorius Marx 270]|uniref:Uncharacterized protein n=1 Tax=Pisolithus tinctorius Marx 270 TaxID=870435 RepID=A0A0C3P628_PISTI|nr:hypothetical protein M404DRAFT_645593 [Pisolithus tinctorius Marx 270]
MIRDRHRVVAKGVIAGFRVNLAFKKRFRSVSSCQIGRMLSRKEIEEEKTVGRLRGRRSSSGESHRDRLESVLIGKYFPKARRRAVVGKKKLTCQKQILRLQRSYIS